MYPWIMKTCRYYSTEFKKNKSKSGSQTLYIKSLPYACGADVSDVIVNGNILVENYIVKVANKNEVIKNRQIAMKY